MEIQEMKEKLKEAEKKKNNLEGELNAIKKELKEHFGTDDIDSLKKKLSILDKDIKKKTEWLETAKEDLNNAFVNFSESLRGNT